MKTPALEQEIPGGTKEQLALLRNDRRARLLFLLGLFSQILSFWVLSPIMLVLYRYNYDLASRLKWIAQLLNAICSSSFYIGLLAGLICKKRRNAPKLILWAGIGYVTIPTLFIIFAVGDSPIGEYWSGMLLSVARLVFVSGGLCLLGGGIGLALRRLMTVIINRLKVRQGAG